MSRPTITGVAVIDRRRTGCPVRLLCDTFSKLILKPAAHRLINERSEEDGLSRPTITESIKANDRRRTGCPVRRLLDNQINLLKYTKSLPVSSRVSRGGRVVPSDEHGGHVESKGGGRVVPSDDVHWRRVGSPSIS